MVHTNRLPKKRLGIGLMGFLNTINNSRFSLNALSLPAHKLEEGRTLAEKVDAVPISLFTR
jgi:hypothetical protein